MKENDKKWLVKSANRVLGPFSLSEVIERVRQKQVAIIDEVRTPEQRWTYIRDSLLFLEVVKEIREEQAANSENTMNSKTATIQTRTMDMERSLTPTDSLLESVKEDLNVDVRELNSAAVVERSHAIGKGDKPVYATTFDPQREQQTKKVFVNLFFVILVIILAIGAGFFGYKKYLDQKLTAQMKSRIQRVYYLKSVGLYQKAYELYKTLPFDVVSEDLEIEMWPIQIQNGNQPYAIRKAAEEKLKNPTKSNKKMELSIVVFLALMAENDPSNYPQAKKILQELIALDPNSDFLKINDALLDLRLNRMSEANKKLKSLIASSIWGYSLYARAQIMISSVKRNLANDFTISNEINNFLSDVDEYFKSKHLFLVTDLKIFSYYILTRTNQNEQASKYLNELLDSPLQQDNLFSNEVLVDWSYYRKLKDDRSICLEAFPEKSVDYKVLLGRFICHFESGKNADSVQVLNTVKQNFGLSDELLNLESQILLENKDSKIQSMVNLKEWGSTQTSLFVKAKVCFQQKNFNCFKENSEKLNANPNNLFRIPMMQMTAEFDYERNLSSEASGHLRELINLEAYYIPALMLRDTIESKKR